MFSFSFSFHFWKFNRIEIAVFHTIWNQFLENVCNIFTTTIFTTIYIPSPGWFPACLHELSCNESWSQSSQSSSSTSSSPSSTSSPSSSTSSNSISSSSSSPASSSIYTPKSTNIIIIIIIIPGGTITLMVFSLSSQTFLSPVGSRQLAEDVVAFSSCLATSSMMPWSCLWDSTLSCSWWSKSYGGKSKWQIINLNEVNYKKYFIKYSFSAFADLL